MNKRIKKKKQKQKNKQLCERYPFVIPRAGWTDKPVWKLPKSDWRYSAPYSYTELYAFPKGWFKAFGIEMLEEIRADCIEHNFLDKLRILQIKEKYGGLRFYTGSIPKDSQIFEIIDKYENMSFHICEYCGRPAETIDNCGWLTTICEGCQAVQNNCLKQQRTKYEKIKQKEKINGLQNK